MLDNIVKIIPAMGNVSSVNNSGRIVLGFKGGGNAGEALLAAPGEAIHLVAHGGTPLAIERLGISLLHYMQDQAYSLIKS